MYMIILVCDFSEKGSFIVTKNCFINELSHKDALDTVLNYSNMTP